MPVEPVFTHVSSGGGQPPYVLAQQALAHAIAAGALAPDQRLPSERHLCEQLGISRSTLRRTLKALEEDGLVESSERRGWRVRRVGFSHSADTAALAGFGGVNRSLGRAVTARVLGARTRPAASEEAERLRITTGAELFELRRLRFLDGLPVCVTHDLVPLAVAPAVAGADFTTASLFGVLAAAGHVPVGARYTARAALADAEQERLLDLSGPSAVLNTRRLSLDAEGAPCADTRETYRGDRHEVRLTLG
ncbi:MULTISPECIES: GntR family transcriptional regulator [unclassified Streptomyces]|uniref:GntR family transcriptional regulator n=1 Tax=unclassified Streptomyces TaxID=2593676 RepID=UPI000DC7C2E8|nr:MULTISPECIES: GntR family transcriptional regulator [unclassified Streptomyces]AWZ08163.1 GntR family transcriptional regulator [Streptomyces sp. ICC4]AWZ15959.1 GntR family transcriptional regulator [Streptomyces sp. ICC1]